VARRLLAFLRAINVGGHVVKMERLRSLWSDWGHESVETFIASGNVIFTSGARSIPRLEARLAQDLEQALGFPVETFIRTPDELARIVDHDAFPDDQSSAGGLYIGFLSDRPSAASCRAVAALATDTDAFHINGRELYWRCLTRSSDSPVTGKRLERALGMPTTMRNITTLKRLRARFD
jgi:uncharacterized protein (DUF1697 family)